LLDENLRPAPQTFLEKAMDPKEAAYVLFGAPLDATASYRRGSRFAPAAIRRESQYLESYSVRTGLDWGDLSLADSGDLGCDNLGLALNRIEGLVKKLYELCKVPVILGGEHTVTFGALRALKPETVIVFDAHLDLRDTLFDEKLCHATYLRRAYEELGFKLVVLGARALSSEELDFAEGEDKIRVVTARELASNDVQYGLKAVSEALKGVSSAYLSVDMDVIDPSQAPAVGNPSPEGLNVTDLLDLVGGFMEKRFVGFDLTEVSPFYDSGLTSVQAAYVVLETLYSFEVARRRQA
jgi:agmatinase